MERVEGIEAVNKALNAIKTSIESFNGTFKIITPVSKLFFCLHI